MTERLRRLLLVVPAVSARQGVPLKTLAAELGCTPKELEKDIELLGFVGMPPFEPDDCIELEVLNGRVYVHLPQGFERPTRLTSTEAAVLAAAARAAAPADPLLRRAEEKISDAVQPAQRALYDALRTSIVVPEEEAHDVANTVQEAVVRRKELEIDYVALNDLAAKTRRVRPHTLASIDGIPYLGARKVESGEDRWYRVDRIAAARLTEETFEAIPPVGIDEALKRTARFDRSADLPRATLRFEARTAEAARSRHPGARSLEDGAVEVEVAYASVAWLVSYALSWGGQARVLAPAEAREATQAAIRRALAAHAD